MSSNALRPPRATDGPAGDANGPPRGGAIGDGSRDDPAHPVEPSFRQFAESLSALVWSARPDGFSDYYNRRLLAYLGKTLDEMRGWTWSETLHPDDVEPSKRAWDAAWRTGTEFEVEYRIRRHDGQYRWHRGHAAPIRDEAGRITRWVGTCTDIDDLRRAEERARRFTFLVENSRDFVAICDLDLVPSYVNPAGLEMIGLTSLDEVPSISAADCFFPEDRAFIVEEFLPRALRDGHAEVEVRFRHFRTGAPTWVTYHVLTIRDESGTPIGLATISRNINARKRAEEELRALAAQYRAVYDQAAVGIAEVDLSGRFLRVNARFGEIVGYSPEELIGLHFLEITHPDDVAQGRDRFGRLSRATPSFAYARRYLRKDGQTVWVHAAVSRISEDPGRADRVVAVVEDITDRVRLEGSLRASEERFRGLMEQSPFSIQILAPDGTTLRVNRAWEELWGTTLDRIAGYNMLEDRQLEARGILPILRRAFAGEAVLLPAIPYDPNETIPDVSAREEPRRCVSAFAYPLKDDDERVREVVLVHEDISEARQAEERLQRSEERYRSLVEATAAIVWATAASGEAEIEQPRWAAFTGQDFEVHRGMGWLEAIHPDDRDATADAWIRAVRDRIPFRFEHRLRRADGEYRHMSVRAVPIVGPDGAVREWVGVHTDVTEQKLAEEALREADRRKDEFLATLAHELRNPLAPLRNGLQLMKLAPDDPAAVEEARAMMERQLAHLVRLVDDLLDVSRISRGKIELRKERAELARVVEQAVETSRPAIEAGGHELTIDLPPGPILVDADVTRMAQVFANLLNNAAKYTPRGGRIRLTARRRGKTIEMAVRDDGVGIPAPMLPHVFDMFTQVDRSLERSQGGLGIGLSLVKGLVERHGGSVEARSEGHGKGSEFVVRLPEAPSASTSGRPGPAADGGARGSAGRRILVVDDNRDAAASLAILLKIMGNETRTAHDGLEALEVGAAFRPDVILLDIGMPRLNGYDTARRIREEAWGRDVVLVALTGWGQEDDRRRSREAGFDFHLVKPVEPAALETMLGGLRPSAS